MNQEALSNLQKNSTEEFPLKLYNSLSREKEILVPLQDKHIKMYTCGPTVYHYAHIGNFRTYLFEDLLRRTIQFFGYSMTQVMNLTDVDDKTIRGAIAKGVTLDAYTEPFKKAFFDDLNTLHIQPAEHYPAATAYIPAMIEMIQILLEKKVAYTSSDGSVYFRIKSFPHYGCLSHLKIEDLQSGASDRVAADEYDKDHASDFVLWKSYDPERDGEIFWESPFGRGRPGWHLECSAMAMKLLGETIDIHVGGVDNLFPHHENEIAQSEAYSGQTFVKHWMHAEHLLVDNKKMSKSLNNFFTLRDLLDKGFTGPQVRYMLLQTHYKTQLNFTFQGLEGAKHALQRLNDFILRLQRYKEGESTGNIDAFIQNKLLLFTKALADDLNISVALSVIFDLVREVNQMCDGGKINESDADALLQLMKLLNSVLGVLSFDQEAEKIPSHLQEAFERRLKAREEKNWKLSDELRDYIYQNGYAIEDTPQGARLILKSFQN